MKRRMLAILSAAVMTASVPLPVCAADQAAAEVTQLPDGSTGFTEDGYWFMEFGDTEENGKSFTLGEHGSFACKWDKIRSYSAEVGKTFEQYASFREIGYLKVDYKGTVTLNGNSWFGAHLKYANNQAEVYVVDGWGSWMPAADSRSIGSRMVDGVLYSYYAQDRYVRLDDGTTQEAREFWCVRRISAVEEDCTETVRNTVSLSEHIFNLQMFSPADADVLNGRISEATLYTHGFDTFLTGKACEFDFTAVDWYIDPTPVVKPDPSVEQKRIASNENGIFFISDFESGKQNAFTRSHASLKQTDQVHAEGNHALALTNREADWNCIAFTLDDYALEKEKEYCFQTAVMQDSETIATFRLILEYLQDDGTPGYAVLDEKTAKRNEWVVLSNPLFKVPVSGDYEASDRLYIPENAVIYVDTPDFTGDYYADYASLSEALTVPKLDAAAFVPAQPDTAGADTQMIPREHRELRQYDPNGTALKDLFGPYFYVGGQVTKSEVDDNRLRNFYADQINQITCRSELKPIDLVYEIDGTKMKLTLDEAAPVLSFAEKNGIAVRIDPFESDLETTDILPTVFYTGTEAEITAYIESFVKQLFTELVYRYPKLNIAAFDVREDIFSETDNNDAYVTAVLKAARKYAPGSCKLYLTARNLNNTGQAKKIENRVEAIRAAGDFVDGIGLKMNRISLETADYAGYEKAIARFRALDLDVAVTDASVCNLPDDELWQAYGMMWADFFKFAVRSAENLSAVTFATTADAAYPESSMVPSGVCAVRMDSGEVQPHLWYDDVTDMLNTTYQKIGDVNCDGSVDIADAVLTLRYAVADAEAEISDQGIKNADADMNGKTDEKDAAYILQYLSRKTLLPFAGAAQNPDYVSEQNAN